MADYIMNDDRDAKDILIELNIGVQGVQTR